MLYDFQIAFEKYVIIQAKSLSGHLKQKLKSIEQKIRHFFIIRKV